MSKRSVLFDLRGAWLVLAATGGQVAHAGEACGPSQSGKLVPPEGLPADNFGTQVALWGSVAVVGAPFHDSLGTDAGATFVYRLKNDVWSIEAVLTAGEDAHPYDQFGFSVGAYDDVIAVGAFYGDGLDADSGAVYVYRFEGSSWFQTAELTGSDTVSGDEFCGVAVSENRIVVGARGHNGDAGAAYVFLYADGVWTQEAKLSPCATDSYHFGQCIAIDNNVIVVGSESDTACLFRLDESVWTLEKLLTAWDGFPGELFGLTAAVSGVRVVVGAPLDDDKGSQSGSAYIFQHDGKDWLPEAKLSDVYGMPGDEFSNYDSIAIDGNTIVVGSPFSGVNGPYSGAVHVFMLDSTLPIWSQVATIAPLDAIPNQLFGFSAAVSGDYALLGAPASYAMDEGGSAYFFEGNADCNASGTPDGCDIVDGTSQDNNSNGSPDECDPCLGDSNGDGVIDPLDAGFVQARFGCTYPYDGQGCVDADTNGDGVVDPLDVGFVLARFGKCE